MSIYTRIISSLTSFFILLLCSCGSRGESEKEIISTMQKSLESSSQVINNFTESNLHELKEKLQDPPTAERAKEWYAKAELITTFTKIRLDVIERIKKKQQIESKDLIDAYNTLLEYKKEALSRDSSIKNQFNSDFSFITDFAKLTNIDTPKNQITTRSQLSITDEKMALSILQNEIRKIENKMVAYCNMKVTNSAFILDGYGVIVGQSSNQLLPGDELEITAGVGAFSKAAKATVLIGKKKQPINESGYCSYRINVGEKIGKHQVPVNISFTNPNTGKNEIVEINVKYTIAKKCD